MKKFEYIYKSCRVSGGVNKKEEEKIELEFHQYISQMGQDGWRIISTSSINSYLRVIFEREIDTTQTPPS